MVTPWAEKLKICCFISATTSHGLDMINMIAKLHTLAANGAFPTLSGPDTSDDGDRLSDHFTLFAINPEIYSSPKDSAAPRTIIAVTAAHLILSGGKRARATFAKSLPCFFPYPTIGGSALHATSTMLDQFRSRQPHGLSAFKTCGSNPFGIFNKSCCIPSQCGCGLISRSPIGYAALFGAVRSFENHAGNDPQQPTAPLAWLTDLGWVFDEKCLDPFRFYDAHRPRIYRRFPKEST